MENRGAYSASNTGTKAEVSAVPVRIGSIILYNTTAAVAYLQIFCTPAASVTVGTTAPNWVIPMPATGGLTLTFPDGWSLGGTGLTIAATTTRTGSTGATTDVFFTVG